MYSSFDTIINLRCVTISIVYNPKDNILDFINFVEKEVSLFHGTLILDFKDKTTQDALVLKVPSIDVVLKNTKSTFVNLEKATVLLENSKINILKCSRLIKITASSINLLVGFTTLKGILNTHNSFRKGNLYYCSTENVFFKYCNRSLITFFKEDEGIREFKQEAVEMVSNFI